MKILAVAVLVTILALGVVFFTFTDVQASDKEPGYFTVDKRLLSIMTQDELQHLGQSMVNTYAMSVTCDRYVIGVAQETETEVVFRVDCAINI